ncbi:hypothetical protein HZA73_03025 [candidate division TA06 bacterium]|nr:hypothetical protein [candidate division TA06 bacterium]
MKKNFWPVTLIAAILALTSLAGCQKLSLKSYPCVNAMTVDGSDSDWPDSAFHYFKKKDVSIGFCHNDSFLFVALRSTNQEIVPQVMQGFTVWFQARDGSASKMGIHFPMGRPQTGPGMTERSGKIDPEQGKQNFAMVPQDFEVLVPSKALKQRILFGLAASYGLGAKVSLDGSGKFVYELKVPLVQSDNHLFAVWYQRGEDTGIEILLESDGLEPMAMRGNNGQDRPAGGGPGGMGGGNHRPGGMDGEMPSPPNGGRDPGMRASTQKLNQKILLHL